jgi:tetraacyldisaccharide 4'-kinase
MNYPDFWNSRLPLHLWILWPVEGLYRILVALWQALIPEKQLPVPVVCADTLSLDAGGKTLLLSWVARRLLEKGLRPAIITPGKGRLHPERTVLVSHGDGPEVELHEAGDEAFWLAQTLLGVTVIATADRMKAIQLASSHGCTIVLLEGGLQEARLRKDWNLILLDAACPLANEHTFPLGPLRQSLSRACRRVDTIVYYGATPHLTRATEAQMTSRLIGIRPLGETGFMKDMEGPWWLWTGSSSPERISRLLQAQGVHVEGILPFGAHHLLTAEEFIACSRQARGRRVLVLETDEASILAILSSLHRFDIHVACMEPEWVSGQLYLDHRMNELCYRLEVADGTDT